MRPELARVVDVNDRGCIVSRSADGGVEQTTLSGDFVHYAIRLRPGQLVLVAEHEVIYRGPSEDTAAQDPSVLRDRYIAEWQPFALRHAVEGDSRQIVADGYNLIAERYAQWSRDEVIDSTSPRYLSLVLDSLPPGADMLELGCGGAPTTRRLASASRSPE